MGPNTELQKLVNLNEKKEQQKMNRASETYVTVTKDLTFMSWGSHKVRRNSVGLRSI